MIAGNTWTSDQRPIAEQNDPTSNAAGVDRGLPSPSRRRFLGLSAGALGSTTIAGCIGSGNSGGEITMSHVPTAAMAPVFIAIDEGYFEERDIELSLTMVVSGARAVSQLATGDIDVAQGAVGASTFNSIAQGLPVSLVADSERFSPGIPTTTRVWVHSDHYEEGMTLHDLPDDPTWAINTMGSVNEYMVALELQAHDMTWDDIELTAMPFPDMISAFASDSIDIACLGEPLGPVAREETGAGLFSDLSEVAPELQVAGILFGGPFMQERPDVATSFLEAYVLGIRDYYELTMYDDHVVSLINEYLDIPEESIRNAVPNLHSKNGYLRPDSIMKQQEYHNCRGNMIEDPVEQDDIINHSFLEDALDEIGRVDDPDPTPELFQE